MRRPVQPRALLEASTSGTGWRWPRTGATRTPNAGGPSREVPARLRGSQGFGDRCAPGAKPNAHRSTLKRWSSFQSEGKHGSLKCLSRPPGVSRSKPINTARGTLERRRTCGFKTTGRRPRPGSPFRFGVARCRSPWVRSTPGVPRALGLIRERNRPNDSGAEALRERRRLFEIESNYTVCALRNDDSIRVPLV